MNQPELGRKIVELRKARGLTQEELVEKCNLSVRTLQRIESGEVEPRSYTIKILFAALDFQYYDSSFNHSGRFTKTALIISYRLEQLYRYIIDLFNLKTNTMKKVSILSIIGIAVFAGLFLTCFETKAQKQEKVREIIEQHNKDFIRWFNNGQIDSLLTIYSDDACTWGGCGKSFIRNQLKTGVQLYEFKELSITSIYVNKSTAFEKGNWTIGPKEGASIPGLDNGLSMSGEYMTEWHKINGEWLEVYEINNQGQLNLQ